MAKRLLRARWVVPICEPPIENGVVEIEGDRISAVRQARPGDPAGEDLGDAAILPGLVNAHTHLEFSLLERPLGTQGMTLPEWIRLVIAQRGSSGEERRAEAIEAGLAESLAAGVTGVVDIATTAAYPRPDRAPRVLPLCESIGFSTARVDSALAAVEECRAGLSRHGDAGWSPHAPYTVHPRLVERIVDAAVRSDSLVAMHLAESREELQLLRDGAGPFRELLDERSMWDGESIPRGTAALDYLKQLARAPRALVVHGNYLNEEEIAFCAAHRERLSVVYCPRTHAYFGHEPYPLQRMLDAGVRVVVGTDSRASNPDLSVLGELRELWRRHPRLEPSAVLRMATVDAAEAVGWAGTCGELRPGVRADWAAVPVESAGADVCEAVLLGNEG
ncbi:MAG: amidohydrolase family protein [Planctomycetota bacterium]